MTESGWVIERANSSPAMPLYWTGAPLSAPLAWSGDHMLAVRFARDDDAEAVALGLMLHWPEAIRVRICEHCWIGEQLDGR